jgi:hypothetical protein
MSRPHVKGSTLDPFILALLANFKIRSSLSEKSAPQTYKETCLFTSTFQVANLQRSTFKDEIGVENATSIAQRVLFVSMGIVKTTEYPPGSLFFRDANSHA